MQPEKISQQIFRKIVDFKQSLKKVSEIYSDSSRNFSGLIFKYTQPI